MGLSNKVDNRNGIIDGLDIVVISREFNDWCV